jgi:hypothetical protein
VVCRTVVDSHRGRIACERSSYPCAPQARAEPAEPFSHDQDPNRTWALRLVICCACSGQLLALNGPAGRTAQCRLVEVKQTQSGALLERPVLMWWTAPAPGIEVP